MLDEDQFQSRKEIEKALNKNFVMKRYTFVVRVTEQPKDLMQNGRYFFIKQEDFDFWGYMKQNKKESLISLSFDLVVDFTRVRDELMTNEYVLTLINNTFRVTFNSKCSSLYDLVIDSKKDDDMLNRIDILKNYLSMLLGQR